MYHSRHLSGLDDGWRCYAHISKAKKTPQTPKTPTKTQTVFSREFWEKYLKALGCEEGLNPASNLVLLTAIMHILYRIIIACMGTEHFADAS